MRVLHLGVGLQAREVKVSKVEFLLVQVESMFLFH